MELEAVRIKKVGVLSAANMSALIMAAYGFIMGIALSVLTVFYDPSILFGFGVLTNWIGYSSFLILPILYWIFGFILGAIVALLYNLFAKITNGVELYA